MSDLLDLAIDAHGGLERWRSLKAITVTMEVGGALFAFKGHGDGLGTVRATADATTPRLIYTPFAGSAHGEFEPERVAVMDRHLDNPRAACSALPREAPWEDLHLLYFTGYAMWNYLCTPFLFTWPGFDVEEIEPWTEGSQTWRRLRVTFPPDVPTHNPEQIFYFDDAGLLRRLDYAPEVLGSAPAAHYCDGHKEFSGLVVPTRRRVYRRRDDGSFDPELAFIKIDLSDVTVS